MSDRAWALTGWLLIVSGLGRTDYRSKSAKVAVTQRKELAMRRIICSGEKRAKGARWESLLNPYGPLFPSALVEREVQGSKTVRAVDMAHRSLPLTSEGSHCCSVYCPVTMPTALVEAVGALGRLGRPGPAR